MTMKAFMRVLGSDERPLVLHEQGASTIVEVPGFGFLVLGPPLDGIPIAALFRPPSSRPYRHPDVNVIDGRVEVAMLHKTDRLDVVIEGLADVTKEETGPAPTETEKRK